MSYLAIEGLSKHYGNRNILSNVSLSIGHGEFLSLLGPSGCGKTTLLRIIAGFESPDTGRLLLDGREITPVSAAQRGMGMVFQAYSLFPNMTALDNVRFGLRIRKLAAKEQLSRARDMLALVGLADHMQKYPSQLSGGQQQRVALARALAIRPALLLLDEPLSALDAKVRVQLRDEIRNIQREAGVATIFVTHDQEEALSISDRVAVMHDGSVAQIGSPAEIYGTPRDIFVARFIGISTEFDGVVTESNTVRVGGVTLPASQADGLPKGAGVRVLIRPENVHLNHAGSGSGPALAGHVISETFFGATTQIRIELAEGGSLIATLPTIEAAKFPPATPICAIWAPEAPHLFLKDGRQATSVT